jgi:hypothetical protein
MKEFIQHPAQVNDNGGQQLQLGLERNRYLQGRMFHKPLERLRIRIDLIKSGAIQYLLHCDLLSFAIARHRDLWTL